MLRLVVFAAGVVAGAATLLLLSLAQSLYYGKTGLHLVELPGILQVPATLVVPAGCWLALVCTSSVLVWLFQGTSVTADVQEDEPVDTEAQRQLILQSRSSLTTTCMIFDEMAKTLVATVVWGSGVLSLLSLAQSLYYGKSGVHLVELPVTLVIPVVCCLALSALDCTWSILMWHFQEGEPVDTEAQRPLTQQPRSSLTVTRMILSEIAKTVVAAMIGFSAGSAAFLLTDTPCYGKPGLHSEVPGILVILAVCCVVITAFVYCQTLGALDCTSSVLVWLIQGTSVTADVQEGEPVDTEAQRQLTQQSRSSLTTTRRVLGEIAKTLVATMLGISTVLSLIDTCCLGIPGLHFNQPGILGTLPVCYLVVDGTWSILVWLFPGTSVTADPEAQLSTRQNGNCCYGALCLGCLEWLAVCAGMLGLADFVYYCVLGLHFHKVMHPYWGTACIFLSSLILIIYRLRLDLSEVTSRVTEEPLEHLTEVPVGIPVPKMMGFAFTDAQSCLVQQQELKPGRLVRHVIPSQMLAFLSRSEAYAAARRDYRAAAAARTQADVVSDRSIALEQLWMEEQLAVCEQEYTRAGQLRDQQKLIEVELESWMHGLVTTSSANPVAVCPSAPPADEFEERSQQTTYFAPPIYCDFECNEETLAQTAQMAPEQEHVAVAPQIAQEQDCAAAAARMAHEHEHAAVAPLIAQEHEHPAAAAQMTQDQEHAATQDAGDASGGGGAQMAQEQEHAVAPQMTQKQEHAAGAQMTQEQDCAAAAARMAQEQDYDAGAQMSQEQDHAATENAADTAAAAQMANEQEHAVAAAQMPTAQEQK